MTRKRLLVTFVTLCFLSFAAAATVTGLQQAKPRDVVILKGSPMGGVKLDHKTHSEVHAAKKCETCHHASKPEKPASSPQQACTGCHTKPVKPPMKTGLPGAFHNPLAKAGTCIDCHLKVNAKGKKAPTKCLECHKKTNV